MEEDKRNGVILKEVLGTGGFGCVYKCNFLNKPHVVKKVKKASGYYSFKMVMAEYVILSELKHPRILSLVHFYQTNKEYNFVLNYMSNGSLRDLLNRFKKDRFKLGESDLLGMFMDIVVGIQYLHSKGVIHRDLKPENILLDESYRGVVADFGIAKLVETHEAGLHTAVGTISYMAPEVYLHLPYDRSVDTWALGLIFYEMAMMKYAFTEMDKARILNKNLVFHAPKIECEQRNYSPQLQNILNLILQRDPKKRADLSILCRVKILEPYYMNVKQEEEEALKKNKKK